MLLHSNTYLNWLQQSWNAFLDSIKMFADKKINVPFLLQYYIL